MRRAALNLFLAVFVFVGIGKPVHAQQVNYHAKAQEIIAEFLDRMEIQRDQNPDVRVDQADFQNAIQRESLRDVQGVANPYVSKFDRLDVDDLFFETLADYGIVQGVPQADIINICHAGARVWSEIQTYLRLQGKVDPMLSNLSHINRAYSFHHVQCPCQGNGLAKALVFPEGYVASLDQFGEPQPEEVCLTHLGEYDSETGAFIGDHYNSLMDAYVLTGKYLESRIFVSFSEYRPVNDSTFPSLSSTNNDFRFNFFETYPGITGLQLTLQNMWAAQANMYYHTTRFRRNFFSDGFINSLMIPADLKTNLKHRQFRPDFTQGGVPMVHRKPIVGPMSGIPGTWQGSQNYVENTLAVLQRDLGGSGSDKTFYGMAFDPTFTVGEYAALPVNWLLANPEPLKINGCAGSGYQTNVTACMEDATNLVIGAWYSGQPEVYRDAKFNIRLWCKATNNPGFCDFNNLALACDYPHVPGSGKVPCDRGYNVDNVFMYLESNSSYPAGHIPQEIMPRTGLFNYPFTSGTGGGDGRAYPSGQELTALFFAGLFYDFAYEVGMGWRSAARLWFQKLHRISSNDINMRQYGATIMQAADDLWPADQYPLLHQALFQAITSRGIPLNGVAYFWQNLPPTIGTPANFSAAPFGAYWEGKKFGSFHPRTKALLTADNIQIPSYFPGYSNRFRNTYQELDDDYEYMAYTLYKHSKFGPYDDLTITDGTFDWSFDPANPQLRGDYLHDGSYYIQLELRQAGNATLLVPMNSSTDRKLNFLGRYRHCLTEEICSRFQDQSPFGFRVIQKMKNGFSFTAQRIGGRHYRISVEDPSLEMTEGPRTGAAEYFWEIRDQRGNLVPVVTETKNVGGLDIPGHSVRVYLAPNQPVEISVTRVRDGYAPDTLTKVERANDLDRDLGNGPGRSLVRNCLQNKAPDGLCL